MLANGFLLDIAARSQLCGSETNNSTTQLTSKHVLQSQAFLGVSQPLLPPNQVLFGSQAFGARNYKLVGLVYQRVLLIMAVVATPMSATLLAAKPLLLLGGQTPEVAATTAAYIR